MTTTINASTTAGLIQTADTSGSLQLQTANLPAVTIDASQNTTLAGTLTVTGATTLNSSTVKAMTAQASTSGTSISFTSIPSWVKRITVLFNGVSTSGTSIPIVQIGSGSTTTTGYVSVASNYGNGGTGVLVSLTTGVGVTGSNNASASASGVMTINNISGNIWVFAFTGQKDSTNQSFGSGLVTLSNTLDRVVLTTVNGTDTFDAGSVNIFYE
jgi:hypothetical protein